MSDDKWAVIDNSTDTLVAVEIEHAVAVGLLFSRKHAYMIPSTPELVKRFEEQSDDEHEASLLVTVRYDQGDRDKVLALAELLGSYILNVADGDEDFENDAVELTGNDEMFEKGFSVSVDAFPE